MHKRTSIRISTIYSNSQLKLKQKNQTCKQIEEIKIKKIHSESIFEENNKKQVQLKVRRKNIILKRSNIYSVSKKLTYSFSSYGNNENLIKTMLKKRGFAHNEDDNIKDANLIWGYIKQNKLKINNQKKFYSRIKNSNQLTDKSNLYKNIIKYADKNQINIQFLPITIILNKNDPVHQTKENIEQFLQYYNFLSLNTTLNNCWIIKPTNMNQGRNIHLVNTLQQFLIIVTQLDNFTITKLIQKQQQTIINLVSQSIRGRKSVVIQKYIQNPLLINNHKFDIRIWGLVDQYGKFYVFQQGYLRFSCQQYTLDNKSKNNKFMHLTNHALQKYGPTYQTDQSLQSINILRQYLGQQNVFNQIMKQIHQIISISFKSCLKISQKHNNFQIFGFDFMIDRNLQVRLIQANCNPAISLDNKLLQNLIPKMIDQAFKLTIDKFYKKHTIYSSNILQLSWKYLGNLQNQTT